MFSNTVEYALRAVAHLAYKHPDPCTTEDIAIATKVPAAYLAKVLQSLSRAGLVRSQRGVGGGMTLAISPEELTLLQVVNAVEEIKRITTCPLGLKAHGVRLCPLHKRLDNALAAMETAFRETTLAEILSEPTDSPPLCEEPIQLGRKPNK